MSCDGNQRLSGAFRLSEFIFMGFIYIVGTFDMIWWHSYQQLRHFAEEMLRGSRFTLNQTIWRLKFLAHESRS